MVTNLFEQVIEHLKDEESRSQRFLPSQSHEKVAKLCQDAMVSAHKDSLYAVCRHYIENSSTTGMYFFSVLKKHVLLFEHFVAAGF